VSLKAEMHQAVVEVGTDICQDIDEAFVDVGTLRKTISSIAGELGLPVRFIGVGEGLDDLRTFDSKDFTAALLD